MEAIDLGSSGALGSDIASPVTDEPSPAESAIAPVVMPEGTIQAHFAQQGKRTPRPPSVPTLVVKPIVEGSITLTPRSDALITPGLRARFPKLQVRAPPPPPAGAKDWPTAKALPRAQLRARSDPAKATDTASPGSGIPMSAARGGGSGPDAEAETHAKKGS